MTLCINPHCSNPQNLDNAQFCQSCDSELLLKHRYRAVRVLGAGGFGKTYEALDQGKPNKVIKVLTNHSPKAVELFQREAEVLSQLKHPGIPAVASNGCIEYRPANSLEPIFCLVMDKVEGTNLRDYLRKSKRTIDSDTAVEWLQQVALILRVVHERGIIHRDIKPTNIILKPDGTLALIDFGSVGDGGDGTIFTASDGGETEVATHVAQETFVASRGYTAPEQQNGKAMKQSDLYSLAHTIVFLMTGKDPSEIPYDALNDKWEWQQYAQNVKPELAGLINQMQSLLVRDRPSSVQEVLHILNQTTPGSLAPHEKKAGGGGITDDVAALRDSSNEEIGMSKSKSSSDKKLMITMTGGGVVIAGVLVLLFGGLLRGPNHSPTTVSQPPPDSQQAPDSQTTTSFQPAPDSQPTSPTDGSQSQSSTMEGGVYKCDCTGGPEYGISDRDRTGQPCWNGMDGDGKIWKCTAISAREVPPGYTTLSN